MISLGSTKQPFMGIGEVAKKSLDSSFPTGHFLSHTRHEPRHRWHRLSLTHFPQRFPIDSRWCLLQISKSPLQPWKVTWKNWPGTSKNGFVRCEQKYFLVIFFMKRPCLKVPDEMLFFLPVEIMSNDTIQSFQMKFQDLEGCSTTVSSFVWTWLGEVRLKVACFLGKLWMHTWVCSWGYKWVYKVWPWL